MNKLKLILKLKVLHYINQYNIVHLLLKVLQYSNQYNRVHLLLKALQYSNQHQYNRVHLLLKVLQYSNQYKIVNQQNLNKNNLKLMMNQQKYLQLFLMVMFIVQEKETSTL
ncbi:hypothetical protein XaC1_282 [Xanthomonas phage XaC1]|nr:hypothetical protein XaC1_282 [Xanthomonas phage XaC1]